MGITIADAQDAWLSGKADVQTWAQEFEAQWFEPLSKMIMMMVWARMSPEQHEALRQAVPQAHDAVQNMLYPREAPASAGGGQHGL